MYTHVRAVPFIEIFLSLILLFREWCFDCFACIHFVNSTCSKITLGFNYLEFVDFALKEKKSKDNDNETRGNSQIIIKINSCSTTGETYLLDFPYSNKCIF